jgi:hypothetical protein
LIWSIFAKSMKEIRKIEKEKKQRIENIKMDPGKPFGPAPNSALGPTRPPSELVPLTPLPPH